MLPLPPKPDGPISGIRLSSQWPLMDWLRHSTQGVRKSRTSRVDSRPAHLDSRRSTALPPRFAKPRCSVAPTGLASRHSAGPFELSKPQERAPLSYPPWLHDRYSLLRYYGGSDPRSARFPPLTVVP